MGDAITSVKEEGKGGEIENHCPRSLLLHPIQFRTTSV